VAKHRARARNAPREERPLRADRKRGRTVGPARGGQDPTRAAPAGSRTETKIAKQSELGSDNAAEGD